MFFELVIGLGMAMIMHSAFKGRGLLRTVVLVPYAILTVVTAITWQTIFNPELGFVTTTLSSLGLPGADTVWLGERGWALAVFVIADVWKTAPFMALLLLAVLLTAMLGAVAGLASRDGVEVVGMEAAAVSYPRFLDHLATLA